MFDWDELEVIYDELENIETNESEIDTMEDESNEPQIITRSFEDMFGAYTDDSTKDLSDFFSDHHGNEDTIQTVSSEDEIDEESFAQIIDMIGMHSNEADCDETNFPDAATSPPPPNANRRKKARKGIKKQIPELVSSDDEKEPELNISKAYKRRDEHDCEEGEDANASTSRRCPRTTSSALSQRSGRSRLEPLHRALRRCPHSIMLCPGCHGSPR